MNAGEAGRLNAIDSLLSGMMRFGFLREIFLVVNSRDRKTGLASRRIRQGGRVLCVGSGLGLEAEDFKRRGFRPVAIELDRGLSRLPKKFFGIPSVNGSASCLPFKPGSFDAVFLASVLHHIPTGLQEKSMLEFARVLKKGGVLVLVEPKPDSLLDNVFDNYLLQYGFYGFFDFAKTSLDVVEEGGRQVVFAEKGTVGRIPLGDIRVKPRRTRAKP